MGKEQRLRAGGTTGGREAGTILALPDDVMVHIFQHIEEASLASLLVVIPSVRVPGQSGPDQSSETAAAGCMAQSMCPLPPDWSRVG